MYYPHKRIKPFMDNTQSTGNSVVDLIIFIPIAILSIVSENVILEIIGGIGGGAYALNQLHSLWKSVIKPYLNRRKRIKKRA